MLVFVVAYIGSPSGRHVCVTCVCSPACSDMYVLHVYVRLGGVDMYVLHEYVRLGGVDMYVLHELFTSMFRHVCVT